MPNATIAEVSQLLLFSDWPQEPVQLPLLLEELQKGEEDAREIPPPVKPYKGAVFWENPDNGYYPAD